MTRVGHVARDKLRHHLDVLPFWERRLSARRLHRAAFWTGWEHVEIVRQRRRLAAPPSAHVAVVVPTFRRPELLRKAVESVLAQTVRDLVVVVVDDGGGGTDGLPDDPRVHVVPLSRNTQVLGVVNNVGIGVSDSRFVASRNDGNSWRPRHLERTLAQIEAGADVVYAGLRRHTEEGEDVDVLAVPFDRAKLRRAAFTDSSSLVFRRSAAVPFSRVPRGRANFPMEDWVFVWRMSRRHRVALSPEVTVDYLIHVGSYLTDWRDFLHRWRTTPGTLPGKR